MPKETVYGEQLTFDPKDANPQVPVVDVMWGRDQQFVQIASKVESPDGGRWAEESPNSHVSDGMYVDLNRASVNKLIRNLRRARDQAFGRDE